MEDVEFNSTPDPSTLPEAGNDPQEPVRPEIDEEASTPNPPIAAPQQDMELTEAGEGTGDLEAENKGDDLSDAESVLSEVDEAQFEDFDPNAIAIEDRPAIAVDDSNVNLIGVHKRKRDGDADGGRKKRKESRREKPRKSRKRRGEDDNDLGGAPVDTGPRERRSRKKATPEPEDWENLPPEERRKRELDAKMDAALKSKTKRRAQKGIDLEAQADAEIDDMRRRMTDAAKADNEGRERGLPATNKLKLLPEVVALLNRNNLQNNLVDPDINLLQAVRFFLEPLNDGSLPAYNIQRELFATLAKLPITKDSLVASGIGKVIHFYTKSKRPEAGIKTQAERLMAEWTRPILKRTDDYRKKEVTEAAYDPTRLPDRSVVKASSQQQAAAAARAKALATPGLFDRARQQTQMRSFTIAPKSQPIVNTQSVKPVGQTEAARRLKLGRSGGGRRG